MSEKRPRIIGSLHGVLKRANTINEAELARRRSSCASIVSMSEQTTNELESQCKCDDNNNLLKRLAGY